MKRQAEEEQPTRLTEYTKEPEAFVEICLNCPMDECLPDARSCPLSVFRRREMDIPQDLEELARTMTARAIADRYGVTTKRVRGWFQTRGILSRSGRRFREPPPGFREMYYHGAGIHKLRKIYHAGENTVRRWIIETEKEDDHE